MFFSHDPSVWLRNILINAGLGFKLASVLGIVGLVLFVLFLSWLSNLLTKTIISYVVTRIVKRTTSVRDYIFLHPEQNEI